MVWVYLVSDDGSDIELQEWDAKDVKRTIWNETHWAGDNYYKRSCFTTLRDAKYEAVQRQLKLSAQIKENIKNIRALTPTFLKQEYLR